MRYIIKKRAMTLILLAMASTIVILCSGCNNSTPTQATNNKTDSQKDTFNEEDAKKQSRSELDEFLALSKNETFIANDNEVEKIRGFVDNRCKEYFTSDFVNDTTNTLSSKSFGDSYMTFYLNSKAGKVSFYNNYKIYSPTVENEIITYELKSAEVGFVPTTYVNVQMKMENGKWKINKTLH